MARRLSIAFRTAWRRSGGRLLNCESVAGTVLFVVASNAPPGLHAAHQYLLLALRRHVVESLQPLFEFLLAVGRKAAKIPVVLQRLPRCCSGDIPRCWFNHWPE